MSPKNIGIENNTGEINGGFLAGVMNFTLSPAEDDDKSLSCAHCGHDADTSDIQENGKIQCKKCHLDFFVIKRQTKNTTTHLNVPKELQDAYNNTIFRIDLKMGARLYTEANSICDEAIQLYALTPRGLEYKALCMYFTTPRQDLIAESARRILVYLENAREIDPTSKNGENIAGTIAFKYYRMLKYRIQNIQKKQMDVNELCKLISEFSTCYRIFPSIQFLKTQIHHLSGREGYSLMMPIEDIARVSRLAPSKYKELRHKGEIYFLQDRSSYSNGIFQLLSKLEKEIRKVEPHYRLPILQIGYDDRIITTDTFFLLKEGELEQADRNRIAQEEQEEQERIELAKKAKRQRFFTVGGSILGLILLSFVYFHWETFSFVKHAVPIGIGSGILYQWGSNKIKP